ncbi:hypothetical protein Smp_040270 [Schistosoma mansoni]|uniref:Protein LTV1 homolog n=1 Tax=Schistosoma mansoni TaxID=6183 RepID=G4VAW5_SCHMA|nr:hypothetical protein Smp_040270 [Schistosoma mansoni]|eukprot:XP_018649418.1 hypothetical protein Smp_040270 [Schistosoma mansoni]
MMKKFNRKDFKQCELKPVEKELSKPLPGVPIHFNYGVFFDDGYDYMQHLKSADTKEAYVISVIPEDCASNASSHSDSSRIREPEVDYDEHIISDLNMDSEAESFDTGSELEDNFVELAGGHSVKSSEIDSDNAKVAGDTNSLNAKATETDISRVSKDKVALMERFLYGANENSEDITTSSSGQFTKDYGIDDYSDDSTSLNKEFEKLMLRFRSRSSCSQSLVSGTSVMSEGLKYALGRDIAIAKKDVKQDRTDFDDDLKAITIKKSFELSGVDQQEDSGSDSTYDGENTERMTMSCSNSNSNLYVMKQNHLTMPSSSKTIKKSSTKGGSQNNDGIIEFSKPLDPGLLVREKGESMEQKRLRKATIKEHRQLRRKIRKINQLNFRQEKERQIKNNMQTMIVH